MKNSLKIEFFNNTTINRSLEELKNKFHEVLQLLPEYFSHIKKLGVFVADNINVTLLKEAIKYTGMVAEPWDIKIETPMAQSYFNGIQAISVSYGYTKKVSENETKRNIMHELIHGIYGHGIRESHQINSFYKMYFQELSEKKAVYVINVLINFHRDFQVDCCISEKYPIFSLESLYDFSRKLSINKLAKRVKELPLYARRWDIAVCLVEYYKSLAILNHLPEEWQNKEKTKKSKNKFQIMLKASRAWLNDILKKQLPSSEKIISETDLGNLSKLMLCYGNIVESKI